MAWRSGKMPTTTRRCRENVRVSAVLPRDVQRVSPRRAFRRDKQERSPIDIDAADGPMLCRSVLVTAKAAWTQPYHGSVIADLVEQSAPLADTLAPVRARRARGRRRRRRRRVRGSRAAAPRRSRRPGRVPCRGTLFGASAPGTGRACRTRCCWTRGGWST